MQSWFTFELDGEPCRVEGEAARLSLGQFLAGLDPFYKNYGGEPWIGAAPVLFADTSGPAPRFRCTDAHLIQLPMVADSLVWTPEGIAAAAPSHPAVRAAQTAHAECGDERRMNLLALFFEGYYRPDLRRRGQLNEQFDSLVSRTADFRVIRSEAEKLFASAETIRHRASQLEAGNERSPADVWNGKMDAFKDSFTQRLYSLPASSAVDYVDTEKNRFYRPQTIAELHRIQTQLPGARFVSGTMKTGSEETGEKETETWISLDEISELRILSDYGDRWEIGGGISLSRISESLGTDCPVLGKAVNGYSSRLVRNRVPISGYLAGGDSIGQLAPALLALDARVILISPEGARDAALSHFYNGDGGTILRSGEMIHSVVIPQFHNETLALRGATARICDTFSAGPRKSFCEPFVSGAFAAELNDSVVVKAWIAYSGLVGQPIRARRAEEGLAGRPWTEESILAVLPVLFQEIEVTRKTAGQAGSEYRKQMAMTLFQKFYHQHHDPAFIQPAARKLPEEFDREDEPFFDALTQSA